MLAAEAIRVGAGRSGLTDARVALLERLIDHAPTFPPASLPPADALAEDGARRRARPRSCWAAGLAGLAARTSWKARAARSQRDRRRAGARRPRVEAIEVPPERSLDYGGRTRAVYLELPLGPAGADGEIAALGRLRLVGAKVRCGGAATPLVEQLAGFIRACREPRRRPSRRPPASTTPVRRGASTASSTCWRRSCSATRRRRWPRTIRRAFGSTPTRSAGAIARPGRRSSRRRAQAAALDRQLLVLRARRGASGARTAPVSGFGVFSTGDGPAARWLAGRRRSAGPRERRPRRRLRGPELNPFLALGRTAWEDAIGRIETHLAAGQRPAPASRRGRAPPSLRGRGLRRLLLLARARDQSRPSLPSRRRAAPAQLAPPARRLPRPRRDRRRLGNPGGAPVRPIAAPRRRPAGVRAVDGASTSSWSSASSSASAAGWGSPFRSTPSPTTSSGSCS